MRTALASSLLALAACNTSHVVVGDLQEITSLRAVPNRDLDILFVIDNSVSMADKQVSLAQNFPLMMDALASLDGGLPDLHIGVITSDMGTLGSASPTPAPPIGVVNNGGCADRGHDGALRAGISSLNGAFISDIGLPNGDRETNYTGELREVFAELAIVGDRGCGFEQHLASMRRALSEPPGNAGFLRPGANLAIVIIADEDDCSVLSPAFFGPASPSLGALQSFRCTQFGIICDPDDTAPGDKSHCVPRADSTLVEDIQPFIDAVLAVKPDPRMVMVAAIVGDPEPVSFSQAPDPGGGAPLPTLVPSCIFNGPNGSQAAAPAVRLAAFLDAFPGRSHLASICSSDLSTPLAEIGATAKKLVGDPCLDSAQLADSSADPGVQPACEVVDMRDSIPGVAYNVPGCDGGSSDCFEIVSDAASCPTVPDHLRVRVRRSAQASLDTWTHVRCQLQR